MKVKIEQIVTKYNPRTEFDLNATFLQSIKDMGLMQPLLVQKVEGGKFLLLDGERRLRACKKLKLSEVDVYVKEYDEYTQKQVAIMSDLMKDLLPLGDKAVGIANLVNGKKHTPESIANTLGLKKAMVNKLIKLAKLSPKALAVINKGVVKLDDALQLTKIPQEKYQVKVAENLMRNPDYGFGWVLRQSGVYELPFDDVFAFEQAKADGKIGIVIKEDGETAVYTFDKNYYEEKKKEYEERTQSSYREAENRGQEKRKKAKDRTKSEKEEAKKERTKLKTKQQKILDTYKDVLSDYLVKPLTKEQVDTWIEFYCRGLGMDASKTIMKAFGVEFKPKDMNAEKYSNGCAEILKGFVKTEKQLPNLMSFCSIGGCASGTLFDMTPVTSVIGKMNKQLS